MQNFSRIKTEIYNKVGIVKLSSPGTLNIIENNTLEEIEHALGKFEAESNIRIIFISAVCGFSKSGEKIFSAGVNLKNYPEKFELLQKNPEEFKKNLEKSKNILNKIENFPKPVIIGINGKVVGGFFELALACDLVLVSEAAVFSLGEVNIGLIPGYGSISRLLRIVGKNKTFEIASSGKKLTSQNALELGIVSEVYPDEVFLENALKFCENLARKSPNSLNLIKTTINQILENPEVFDIETRNFLKAASSQDAKEGISAFLEKRTPEY